MKTNKLLKMEIDFHRRNKNQLQKHLSDLRKFKVFEDSIGGKLVSDLISIYTIAFDNAVASCNFYAKLKEDQKQKDNPDVI